MSFLTDCELTLMSLNVFKLVFKVARCLLTLSLNCTPLMGTTLFTLVIFGIMASSISLSLLLSRVCNISAKLSVNFAFTIPFTALSLIFINLLLITSTTFSISVSFASTR